MKTTTSFIKVSSDQRRNDYQSKMIRRIDENEELIQEMIKYKYKTIRSVYRTWIYDWFRRNCQRYATQKTAEKLQDEGLHTGFINAGGNVVLIGRKSDETWNIGIQDPNKQSSLLQLKTAEPLAIVTSGDYQRNYEVDGVQYAHIIDPKTGYPPRFHRSVTISL